MAKKCPKCKNYNPSDVNVCENCGADISGVADEHIAQEQGSRTNLNKEDTGWFNKRSTGLKVSLGVIVVVCIGVLLILSSGILAPVVTVQNISVFSDGSGGYSINGKIIPDKYFGYIEMDLVWYNASDAVIHRDNLIWNAYNIEGGQTLNVSASTYINPKLKPTKFDMMLYKTGFATNSSASPIYKQTYTL